MSTPDPYGTPGSVPGGDPEFRQERERDAGNQETGGGPQYGTAAHGDQYGHDTGHGGYPQQGHAPYGEQQGHGHGGYPQQGHDPYGDQRGYGYGGYSQQGSGHYGGQQGYGYGGNPEHGGVPYGYQGEGSYGHQGRRYATGTQPGVPVGFAEAIKRFYAKYAQFSGRASRSEYWWATLYLFLANVVLEIMIAAGTDSLGELNAFGTLVWGLSLVFALANFLPSLAITVRRLHDVGLSGWFVLLALVPIAGWIAVIVLLILPPKPEGVRFDR